MLCLFGGTRNAMETQVVHVHVDACCHRFLSPINSTVS